MPSAAEKAVDLVLESISTLTIEIVMSNTTGTMHDVVMTTLTNELAEFMARLHFAGIVEGPEIIHNFILLLGNVNDGMVIARDLDLLTVPEYNRFNDLLLTICDNTKLLILENAE